MSRIFISYRREDSAGWTGRLADRLKERFGPNSIFVDIDTIEPGADFTEALRKAVGSCDVLLAVIGPRWSMVTDKTGKPRLHDSSDWIRVEIAAALTRKIRVIPVLVGGATMPSTEFLPDDLDGLTHSLREFAERSDVNLIVTTGGTGLGPRDNTPEATARVIEREAPGIAEAIRAESLKATPMAMLSRGICGVCSGTLIVNLPGSPKAVRESFAVIAPVLPHALDLLAGNTSHRP